MREEGEEVCLHNFRENRNRFSGKEAMDKLSTKSCRIWNRMELAVMYVRHWVRSGRCI